MKELKIVKIYNPEKYAPWAKKYGILVESLMETAVINFDSNKFGNRVNIKHGEYGVMSPNYWDVLDGEVVITPCGGHIRTGLKIYA